MRLLKGLLFSVVVLLVVALVAAFFLPDRASAERSIVIARPPSMVHAVVDSFTLFNRWSPWADLDPATNYSYEGPERGVGAAMTWASDKPEVGKGRQEITASIGNQEVVTALAFEGMSAATSTIRLTPEGDGTRVTWRFDTALPLGLDGDFFMGVMGRYFGLAMDGMIGKDYDKGLGKLKSLLEGMPNADIAGLEGVVQEVAAQPAYAINGLEAGVDSASSSAVMGAAYGEIVALAQANGIKLAGPPFALIRGHGDGKWQFDAGIPVDRNDVAGSGRIVATTTYAGRVAEFRHIGSYDELATTHAKAEAWLATRGLAESGPRREIYVSDPVATPVNELLSLISIPVQ
jgi:effector-binding domain-containing protein